MTACQQFVSAYYGPAQSWGRLSLDKKSPDIAGASSLTPNRLHQREIWGKHAGRTDWLQFVNSEVARKRPREGVIRAMPQII
jgi:hypothetical protein